MTYQRGSGFGLSSAAGSRSISANMGSRIGSRARVSLGITSSWDGITIRISDNGQGFVVLPGDSSQDGLRNMEQRMLDIGGTFTIESAPGQGTNIALTYRWSRINGFGMPSKAARSDNN